MTPTGSVIPQILIASLATLGAMTIGTTIGWSLPITDMLVNGQFPSPFPISKSDVDFFASMFGIGAVCGALPAGTVATFIGHRYSMIVYELFVILGWLILLMPKALWMLVLGRVLQGFGVGALCSITPTYVGEISEPRIRGRLNSIFQVFVVIGIMYTFVLSISLEYLILNASCGIWAVIHVIGVFFIPESPYFLLKKDREEEAVASLRKLRKIEDITPELSTLKESLEKQNTDKKAFTQLFADKVNRKSVLIGMGCMFFQQMSGINMAIFFLNDFFKSSMTPYKYSISVTIVQLKATLSALYLVDNVGRRILLIESAIIMSVSLLALGAHFMAVKHIIEIPYYSMSWLSTLFIGVYLYGFSFGFGPVPWVVMGEIFSNDVKPYGTGLAIATIWILLFFTTFMTSKLINLIGDYGLCFNYSIFTLLGALFSWFVVPETKNKTFTEIQSELANRPTPDSSV